MIFYVGFCVLLMDHEPHIRTLKLRCCLESGMKEVFIVYHRITAGQHYLAGGGSSKPVWAAPAAGTEAYCLVASFVCGTESSSGGGGSPHRQHQQQALGSLDKDRGALQEANLEGLSTAVQQQQQQLQGSTKLQVPHQPSTWVPVPFLCSPRSAAVRGHSAYDSSAAGGWGDEASRAAAVRGSEPANSSSSNYFRPGRCCCWAVKFSPGGVGCPRRALPMPLTISAAVLPCSA